MHNRMINSSILHCTKGDLEGLQNVSVEPENSEKRCGLYHVPCLVYFDKCLDHGHCALDRLASAIAPFGLCFVPSQCRVLFPDWMLAIPSLELHGEQLTIVDRFTHLDSLIEDAC